ncbi:DUF4287 domain-containing protein [Arenibacter sp. 6A1]|uniref:DUF5655 domain-containing protein n=1 Tax=Arenibacter sp. 6A1 TaxID=2720391 RepID=UPI00144613A4|nr:DUF5655 domain-containing protein [Arenibacter sp. 6A1]NKI25799.1 DUF4287 domain-containing protein [Arenibacter sp. 6A1]
MDKALFTMIENMLAKTGKSLPEWKELLSQKSFSKHTEALEFLKSEYGVTHGFANTIVLLSNDNNHSPQDLVTKQYQGKESLIPIYKKILAAVKSFGDDVSVTPKKSSVSLIRKKQFALIKPATKNRIDLGLKLIGKAVSPRLEDSGPFGAMCTHRVKISQQEEVDKELLQWLKEAYEKAN